MTFKTDMAVDLDQFFNIGEFADEVTYNGAVIPAVFDFDCTAPGAPADVALVNVRMSDVPDPQYRDTFIRDGVTWRLYRDQTKGNVAVDMGGIWQLKVTCNERFKGWGG